MNKLKVTLLCVNILFLFSIICISQTDEYGLRGYNSYLTGLGLNLSYVNITNGSNFNPDSTGGIDCWIYQTTNTSNPKTIIAKGSGANKAYRPFLFGISTANKLFLRIEDIEYLNANGGTIPLNVWTHVAVFWSDKPNYKVKFYINGLQSGDSIVATATWPLNNNDPVRIGSSQYYTSWVFPGNIDEVKFHRSSSSLRNIICNRFIGLCDVPLTSQTDITSSTYYSTTVSSWTFNQSGATAYDYLGGNNGSYIGTATQQGPFYGHPIPYNFALKLPGESYGYIRIPDNTIFDQTTDGSFDFWFKPQTITSEQILISKGATTSTLSFIIGLNTTGKLYAGFGTYIALNSTGVSLDLNVWNHVAVTWNTVGANFEIKFYKNGKQNGNASSITKSFPTNADYTYIGNSQISNLPAKGFLDELRLWNTAITTDTIIKYMFVSGNSFSNSNLLLRYGFDGTLNNSTSITGVNGSFNNGAINNARFSGYTNDTVGGAFGNSYASHSTVINRNVQPNTFPNNFMIRTPFRNIPDNNPTGITDSITNNISGTVSSVELFLAVDHTYIGDLKVNLISPNNTGVYALSQNGGAGKNILSFFNDNFTGVVTGTTYLPPWGFVKPLSTFSNFNGLPSNGVWKLSVSDVAPSDIGVLKGWGLKIDYATSIGNENGNTPKIFKLHQNYPNPFNPVTNIKFDIPKKSFVKLKVFDLLGKEMKEIINRELNTGTYNVNFDGSNFASGVYIYYFEAGDYRDTKRMILVK